MAEEPWENDDDGWEGGLVTKKEQKTKKPSMYKVVLYNDDYTSMELVIEILVRFFEKSQPEATHIMLTVHKKGSGVAGVYPYEVAETKVSEATTFARSYEAPLLITMEEA